MALTTLSIGIRLIMFICLPSWTPAYGTRLVIGAPVTDCPVSTMRGLGLVVALISFILKLAALGVDIWDSNSAMATASARFGVLQLRMSGQSRSLSYANDNATRSLLRASLGHHLDCVPRSVWLAF
jgi:hypothetical protein